MKTAYGIVICLTALSIASAFSQPTPPQAPSSAPPPGSQWPVPRAPAEPGLTKFDLDFPGGTPKELVAAIQKATGRPLNAIIPEDFADTRLPALKMNAVDVSQLFRALMSASQKQEAVKSGSQFGPSSYQIANTAFGFRQSSEGRPTDDTIWYFYVERPVLPPLTSTSKVCRFYSLAPYLDRGMTVDDITTAIETGWKMLGDTAPPKISFHKDTKLLIAVGEPTKLEMIDGVLKALGPESGGGGFGGAPPEAKPQPPRRTPAPTAK